jgi:hypothetical protein
MNGAVTVEIDLRSNWSAARDQGLRNSCLAFATTDAHEAAHGLANSLSVEHLYYHAAQRMPNKTGALGLTFESTDNALVTDGQPPESDWQYQATDPNPWLPPPVSRLWYGQLTIVYGQSAAGVLAGLRANRPIVLGLKLTSEWLAVRDVREPIRGTGAGLSGHAVLAVGFGEHQAAGPVLLIRNSWGEGWGLQGHAWIEQSYLADKLIGYSTVAPL